jgi:hypothetical protein
MGLPRGVGGCGRASRLALAQLYAQHPQLRLRGAVARLQRVQLLLGHGRAARGREQVGLAAAQGGAELVQLSSSPLRDGHLCLLRRRPARRPRLVWRRRHQHGARLPAHIAKQNNALKTKGPENAELTPAMAERRAVRATTRQGKQASAPAAGHRRRPVFREGGGPHRSEAWRLSASALWLPEEMILKIVEINLQQATQLPERLGVARLSSVCKAWDAALLPLFHPGVPGVISPAELRKIKRLALDQTNYSPLSDRPLSSQLETLNAHIEATERFFRRSPTDGSLPRRPQHGFLLPERMLPVRGMAENRCTQNRHTFLTDAFVSAVMGHMNDAVTWFNAPVLHQYRKIVCLLTDVFSPQSRCGGRGVWQLEYWNIRTLRHTGYDA